MPPKSKNIAKKSSKVMKPSDILRAQRKKAIEKRAQERARSMKTPPPKKVKR